MPDNGRLILLPGPLSEGSQAFLHGVHNLGLVHMDPGALEISLSFALVVENTPCSRGSTKCLHLSILGRVITP
jgi:hypothetical protein